MKRHNDLLSGSERRARENRNKCCRPSEASYAGFSLARSGEPDNQGITESTGPGQNPASYPPAIPEAPYFLKSSRRSMSRMESTNMKNLLSTIGYNFICLQLTLLRPNSSVAAEEFYSVIQSLERATHELHKSEAICFHLGKLVIHPAQVAPANSRRAILRRPRRDGENTINFGRMLNGLANKCEEWRSASLT